MPDSPSGFQTLSVEPGFRNAVVRWIPDSLSCFQNFNAHDSGIKKQKSVPEFRISQAKICQIRESGCLFMGRGVITIER